MELIIGIAIVVVAAAAATFADIRHDGYRQLPVRPDSELYVDGPKTLAKAGS